ncbi:CDP-glycerol glycerophosphotransferase family protein [Cryobacterium sp. BB307]|uniref:CDP-glycerol glycerophosphotransferase family protein n=1 Tax=Cryobacterium sp. BB307 TaxID=2716317 RepID=UPI0014456220|nr:CDP-glycerol glycerophosphotransferase family protein [Cryobacterium sp. BB307]
MPLVNDLKTARRIVRNLFRTRMSRNQLASIELPAPPENAVVGVHFADGRVNLYQLRQWYGPLLELAKTHPVVIIARSPSATLALLEECPLPVVHLREIREVESFLASQELKLMFYVNQNMRNFPMLRFGRLWHVFINHGESDKSYMSSSQHKAYDYVMVAGDAALDRLRAALWNYDVDKRALVIGRPQADHFEGELPYTPDDRTVVLYSPTWEGDRESMRYGSIRSHGEALVASLISDARFRVIYRPHPRSGIQDSEYGAANTRIKEALRRANSLDPSANHIVDTGGDVGWQLQAADVAISDVSAMVYDRLATGKPLLITRPVSPDAEIDTSGYLGAAEWLDASDAQNVVEAVDRVQHDEDARQRLNFWVTRHFGDTSPGAATARFRGAVEQLIEEWHKHAALHEADPRVFASDDDDDEDDGASAGD